MAEQVGNSEKVEKRIKLEQQLGQTAYQIGKQAEIVNRETKILQNMQQHANEIATEIEKLDG